LTGASLMMDIGPDDLDHSIRAHAEELLAKHLTSATVEVWRGDELVEVVTRPDQGA